MAHIRPFAGIRFISARAGSDLTEVVCPPYDVISPDQQRRLYDRHPLNVVRLELPLDVREPGDRYGRAASQYREWLAGGVLARDSEPALYPLLEEFTLRGATRRRRGVVGALRLEPWSERSVRPHERTLEGPKRDRLELMRACLANFSPIWVLYRDETGATDAFWEQVEGEMPTAIARDGDATVHCLWRTTDSGLIGALRQALARGPVYIADGHHRYETALRFQAEARQSDPAWSKERAANFTLAYLVEVTDPGLVVFGTHRVVSAARPVNSVALRETLRRWFQLHEEGLAGPGDILAALGAVEGPCFGVWSPTTGVAGVARLKQGREVPVELAGGRSDAWRRLDLAALHTLAIDQLFPEGTTSLSETGQLTYCRELEEVEQRIESGQADLAFLVRNTPVEQVLAVADASDLMPEKSTYFFPKPVTGMVIAGLDGDLGGP